MSVTKLKFGLSEIIGAFGDIGILFPIFLGLAIVVGMNPVSLLLSAGFFYVFAGLYFRIPMPVQPLKAVSTIAIGSGLGAAPVVSAGFIMGIILLLSSLQPIANGMTKFFKRPVVRGIQLGIGITLVVTGWNFIFGGALIHNQNISHENGLFNFDFLKLSNIWIGFLMLVIPQLPLTIGNAVVSTNDAAQKYYGEGAKKVSVRSLALSMGLANIISALFHGMPMCHGSGGVTAHYRFGARTGASSVIIGIVLVLFALFFQSGSVKVVEIFPLPLLGAMLIYVGALHAYLVMDLISFPREFLVAISIGVLSVITGNLAAGFGLGIVLNIGTEQIARMRRAVIS